MFQPGKLAKSDLPFPLLIGIVAVVYASVRCWPRPVEQHYTRPNTEIRIVVGDLFAQGTNLVIGMTTTFDTSVPHVISKSSVQAQFLERVYSSDTDALDDALKDALAGKTPIRSISKVGKTQVYPLGTIAVIRQNRRHFFCAAYTEMNERNEAQGCVSGVWQCLENLWDEVRANSNGDAVAMPVIGGGQARMSHVLPAQDSIRFAALSFLLASRERRVCERLDIVVRAQDVMELDMLELQGLSRIAPGVLIVTSIDVPDNKRCGFCDYLSGVRPYTVLRRGALSAILVTWEQRGRSHVLVVPIAHRETILDLLPEEASAVMADVIAAAKAIEATEMPDGIAV